MDSNLLNFYNYCGVYDNLATDPLQSVGGEEETVGEQKRYSSLWGAVILQAMIDITSNYKRTENNIEKMKAFNWINDLHSDFITVCHFAGYNPAYVRNKMRDIVSKSLSSKR
ncbi:hypothetical protein ACIS_00416 [Anaplasma centrale str. Israel]|uniref:Uncharacterized protein n=1 Tax=Anaplasma centrale (strain Israel) TaxID=574556 RepID=D1AU16_ANACI|nr:hypothetical protein [Anaplasma centrale]ACZ49044.1 hypothetical protein ACIS_00416 [Anaplasma centrale str. Israel]